LKSPPHSIDVLLVAPYGERGGGMGRLMESLAEAAPPGFSFSLIESRGRGQRILSLLFMLRAALVIVGSTFRHNRVIVHVNMAERGSVLRKGVLIVLARSLGMPGVLHLHAAEMRAFYAGLPVPIQRLLRIPFAKASMVVVMGAEQAAWVVHHAKIPPSRIALIRNGVATPTPAAIRVQRDAPHLLFLGNLLPRKGVSDLLRAVASPDLRQCSWALTMAGGGDAAAVRHEAATLGIADRVHMPGWLSRPASRALLQGADMLVLPSYNEVLPLAVLEALSFGVPVITTPVGSLPEILLQGETVVFVAPGDVGALSRAILGMLSDPARAGRIGQAGRALYEREFTLASFANRMCGVYRAISKS
jgi:glycosyltransferase involved in cell wall biosynthesis